jgi:hypothetical protein
MGLITIEIQNAAKNILKDTGKPLHDKEITERIIEAGLWPYFMESVPADYVKNETPSRPGSKPRIIIKSQGLLNCSQNILRLEKISSIDSGQAYPILKPGMTLHHTALK